MKVEAHQLEQHLARALQGKGLAPCYVVMSDEPLLSLEASDAIRKAATESGCTTREVFSIEKGMDAGRLLGCFSSGSLFGDRTFVEMRIPSGKPQKEHIAALLQIAQWIKTAQCDAIALVTLPKLNSKAMEADWFSALSNAGVFINCPTVDARNLPKWIEDRLAAKGLKTEKNCPVWLAEHLEGNLMAAKQEIDKLALLCEGQVITLALLQASVANVARYNVFDLGVELLAGKTGHLLRMLDGLESEGEAPTLVLWALGEEIKTLFGIKRLAENGMALSAAIKQFRVWGAKADVIGKALNRHSLKQLEELVKQVALADKVAKGLVREDAWHVLKCLALSIAGLPAPLVLETP